MRLLALGALLTGLCACRPAPPSPPLPEVTPKRVAARDDPGLSIAPRSACTPDAGGAFADPDPQAIVRAGARGETFTCGGRDEWPFLDQAITTSDVARVVALLDAGADPNARSGARGDHFPLQWAIECQHYGYGPCAGRRREIVAALLAHGADPNARWCLFESRQDIGSKPGCTSATAMTPLHMSAAEDQVDVVRLLLDAGADPWAKDRSESTALDYAASAAGFSLLMAAQFPDATMRSEKAWQYLKTRSYPSWVRGPFGTPLARAVTGDKPVFDFPPPVPPPPPRPGASMPTADVPMWSPPLDMRPGLVDLFIGMGADPNERIAGPASETPLSLSIASERPAVSAVLLERGADPNARWCPDGPVFAEPRTQHSVEGCVAERGITPLMLASARADLRSVGLLVQHGVDRDAVDWKNRSAVDFAPPAARRAIEAVLRRLPPP